MQFARCSTGDGKVSQLVPSHTPPPPTTTASSFISAFHASTALSSNRDANDTADCSSFEWQCLEVNLSIRNGKFRQFNADKYFIIDIIVAFDSHVTLQWFHKITFEYITSFASKSEVYITVID
jgi:hypothetical protein